MSEAISEKIRHLSPCQEAMAWAAGYTSPAKACPKCGAESGTLRKLVASPNPGDAMSETAVRERPILFSAPMVKAILDGRKTQTRRVVKNPPVNAAVCRGGTALTFCNYAGLPYPEHGIVESPYEVGGHLWVRETWRETGSGQRADFKIPKIKVPVLYAADDPLQGPWRPSIFMPRWASRITLEITEVRVERLQEISEADALAEGVERRLSEDMLYVCDSLPQAAFATLWEKINGKSRPWSSNPWVWAISFRRID